MHYKRREGCKHSIGHFSDTICNLPSQRDLRTVKLCPWEVFEIVGICKAKGYIPPKMYQAMYNPITRAIEEELLPTLRKLLNLFLYIIFTDRHI